MKPDDGATPPPSFSIGHGKHALGWSPVGASSPSGTVDADVTVNDAHLYNPERTACYWLQADAYGDATVHGVQHGPQPVKEFYSFDKVDTWFGNNPQEIEVDSHASGGTRVALQRDEDCMELAKKGCDPDSRDKFVTCEMAAIKDKSKTEYEKCIQTAPCEAAHGAQASATHPGSAPAHEGHGGAVPTHPGAAPSAHPGGAAPHPSAAPHH